MPRVSKHVLKDWTALIFANSCDLLLAHEQN